MIELQLSYFLKFCRTKKITGFVLFVFLFCLYFLLFYKNNIQDFSRNFFKKDGKYINTEYRYSYIWQDQSYLCITYSDLYIYKVLFLDAGMLDIRSDISWQQDKVDISIKVQWDTFAKDYSLEKIQEFGKAFHEFLISQQMSRYALSRYYQLISGNKHMFKEHRGDWDKIFIRFMRQEINDPGYLPREQEKHHVRYMGMKEVLPFRLNPAVIAVIFCAAGLSAITLMLGLFLFRYADLSQQKKEIEF